MRILFLTHYFPPEVNAPASRTFDHCREWVRQGHEVTVVTCAPSHPAGVVYPGYRNRLFQRETLEGIEVIRVWTLLAANKGVIKRSLSFLSYMVTATLAAPWAGRADVVISTSPQFFCGLAGWLVAKMKRAPWVLEIRDIWPESIVAVGAITNRTLIRALEAVERFAYRHADHIVSVSDGFADHFKACGIPPERITVITNGANLDLFKEPQRDEAMLESLGLKGKFVAGYFGTLGMAHGLATLLDAAELLKDDPRIRFLVVGDGAERQKLLDERERRGLDNVVIVGQQPKQRMPIYWGSCDVSLVLMRKTALFRTIIASKMFEAMAMQRPIILGLDGVSRGIVEAAGCGIPIEPENATELAAALTRLAHDPATARAMGEAGSVHVRAHFDRRQLAHRFLAMLASLTGGTPATARAAES